MHLCNPRVIRFIMGETSFPDGADPAVLPEKPVQEKETALLGRFAPVLQKFVHESIDLQLSALYALQTQCYNLRFPKGTVLISFLYEWVFNFLRMLSR